MNNQKKLNWENYKSRINKEYFNDFYDYHLWIGSCALICDCTACPESYMVYDHTPGWAMYIGSIRYRFGCFSASTSVCVYSVEIGDGLSGMMTQEDRDIYLPKAVHKLCKYYDKQKNFVTEKQTNFVTEK